MATLTSAPLTTNSLSSTSSFAAQTTSSNASTLFTSTSTAQATLTATLPWANGYAAAFTLPSYLYSQTSNACSLTFILTCTLSALCSNRPTVTYQTYRGSLGTPTLYTSFSSSGKTTLSPNQNPSSVYISASARCTQNGGDQSWTCAQFTRTAMYNNVLYALSSSSTSTTISTTKTFRTEEMGYAFVPVTAASSTRGWFGFASTSANIAAAASNLDMCVGTVASVPAPTAGSSDDGDSGPRSVRITLGISIPLGLLILGAFVWKMVAKERAKGQRRRRIQNESVMAGAEVNGRMMDNSSNGTEMQEQRARQQRERRDQEQIPPPAYEA